VRSAAGRNARATPPPIVSSNWNPAVVLFPVTGKFRLWENLSPLRAMRRLIRFQAREARALQQKN
jgi:hypothetical protein